MPREQTRTTGLPYTTLFRSQNYFGRPEVAEKLTELADEGCVVKVAYTEFNFGVDDILLPHPGVELRLLEDDPEQTRIHSKYQIVEVGVDGGRDQLVTVTGGAVSPDTALTATA